MAELAVVAAALPAWCDVRTGKPLSWRHFIYGLRAVARQTVREQVARAEAVRVAGATSEQWTEWHTRVSNSLRGL